MNRRLLDELTEQLNRVLPQAQAMGEEAKESVRKVMLQTFSRMDLVTREEFDAQQRALQRAEQKITELEALIRELEQHQAD